MFQSVVRIIKRLIVFLPAIAVTYFALRDLYPIINRTLPTVLAFLLTYILVAYLLIPLAIRLILLIKSPRHVPFYSTTSDGFASDPVNIGLFGTHQDVEQAMRTIGWHGAEPRTIKSLLRLGVSILLKQAYKTAPFSNLYLFGRSQDLGFQLPLANNPGQRHHVRFWAVKPEVAEQFKEHVGFWSQYQPLKGTSGKKYLWLGAASMDTGLGVIRHNAQLTHMIHSDTNAERSLIVEQLKKANIIKSTRNIKIAAPYQLRNRVITGYLKADGQLTICEL